MYRRLPNRNRKFNSGQAVPAANTHSAQENLKETAKELPHIPLPNEREGGRNPPTPKRTRGLGPFQNIFNRIRIDDLILIGLIFLFLDEGLEEVEDDFLLVILIYLFLSGRD